MSESDLYRRGSTITSSNVNKQNAQDSAELGMIKQDRLRADLVNSAIAQYKVQTGIDMKAKREADIIGFSESADKSTNMRQLQIDELTKAQGAELSDSPQAVADRKWKPSEEGPGLLDSVSNYLSQFVASAPVNAPEYQQSPEAAAAEFEQTQHTSDRAGLREELQKKLGNQQ
jgi:hypothetical protein